MVIEAIDELYQLGVSLRSEKTSFFGLGCIGQLVHQVCVGQDIKRAQLLEEHFFITKQIVESFEDQRSLVKGLVGGRNGEELTLISRELRWWPHCEQSRHKALAARSFHFIHTGEDWMSILDEFRKWMDLLPLMFCKIILAVDLWDLAPEVPNVLAWNEPVLVDQDWVLTNEWITFIKNRLVTGAHLKDYLRLQNLCKYLTYKFFRVDLLLRRNFALEH